MTDTNKMLLIICALVFAKSSMADDSGAQCWDIAYKNGKTLRATALWNVRANEVGSIINEHAGEITYIPLSAIKSITIEKTNAYEFGRSAHGILLMKSGKSVNFASTSILWAQIGAPTPMHMPSIRKISYCGQILPAKKKPQSSIKPQPQKKLPKYLRDDTRRRF